MNVNSIRVVVNGETREVPANQNVTALLACLRIAPDRVAVELNKTLIRKREWQEAAVTEGAQIEIVEFVGGG